MKRNSIEDFFKFVVKGPNCWTWTGTKHYKGYGVLSLQGKKLKAHRASYMYHFGDIPDGMHVLHTCDNPECANPEHLYAGTNDQNVKDKMDRKRHPGFKVTHCPKGHEYPPAGGKRRCVECNREASKLYQRKIKKAAKLKRLGLKNG